jgi:hypothetical protein
MALPWWEPRSGWAGVLQGVIVPGVPVAAMLALLSGLGVTIRPMNESVLQLWLVHAVVLPWLRVWAEVVPARLAEGTVKSLPFAAVAAAWPVSGGHLMYGWPHVLAAWPFYAWAIWLYLRARSMRPPVPADAPPVNSLLPWSTPVSHRDLEIAARRQLRRIQLVGYSLVALCWWAAGLPWWVRQPPG